MCKAYCSKNYPLREEFMILNRALFLEFHQNFAIACQLSFENKIKIMLTFLRKRREMSRYALMLITDYSTHLRCWKYATRAENSFMVRWKFTLVLSKLSLQTNQVMKFHVWFAFEWSYFFWEKADVASANKDGDRDCYASKKRDEKILAWRIRAFSTSIRPSFFLHFF